jgi:cellulose synthase (UDP-forming)
MFNDIVIWVPVLLSIMIPVTAFAIGGSTSTWARTISAIICVSAAIYYLQWRWLDSIPHFDSWLPRIWAGFFVTIETLSVFSAIMVYVFMTKWRDRTPEVEKRINSPMRDAPTDVLIATYNESYEIIERTLVGATQINHPDLRVWILDDGARPWVAELAKEFGALYTSRYKGKNAKAGNINEAMVKVLSTGRRPEFALLLDADFVAAPNILDRTLPLFEENDVGIVQTPQHFFNPDPIQASLLCATSWPDEQRFFFNVLLPSKDAWGAAFCCGTSAVLRVKALELCGGMAIETVTEDMLTTFKMLEQNYRTVFLNERLSLGLAPEGIQEYVSQRCRWGLGAIQQIYTKWGFFGSAKIGLVNRISGFDASLHWLVNYLFKLLTIIGPIVYWWTGVSVIQGDLQTAFLHIMPFMFGGMIFMASVADSRQLPIITDVSHLVCAAAIVRSGLMALFKPFGHPFKVTAKGVSTDSITVQWGILAPYFFLAVMTICGVWWNASPYSPLLGRPGFEVNIFWSLMNVVILTLTCAVCIEAPKKPNSEKFVTNEIVILENNGHETYFPLYDISVGGANVVGDVTSVPNTGTIIFPEDNIRIKFHAHEHAVSNMTWIDFETNQDIRRALISKLFRGKYDIEVVMVSPGGIFKGIMKRLFQ